MNARDSDFDARLGKALTELARAERRSAPAPDWADLAARLERPGILERAPIGLAAALRGAGALLQPAAAGAIAATLAGLVVGTWLGLAFRSGPASSVEAAPYEISSLLDDEADGLAASYLTPAGDTGDAREDAGDRVAPVTADPEVPDSGGAVR